MPVQRVCDTNIFYDVSAALFDPAKLRPAGEQLAITPVSILEIASKVSPDNFAQRKAAARAALDLGAVVLPDPEMHLATIWNVPAKIETVPWRDGLIAIADSSSAEQLERGVDDVQNRVRRTVRVPIAHAWRSFHYADFMDQVIVAVDQYVPGYAKKRAKGEMKQANAETRKKLRVAFGGPAALLEVLLATRDRALLVGDIRQPPKAAVAEIQKAVEQLIIYISVYARYFEKVATTFAPQENDWGDLECFLYLQGDRQVVTAEDRWLDIATELGCDHLLVDTKPLKTA
ncbi:MAG: hypothetical protein ACRENE_07015 [Polyangiaceae bacterium]